MDANENRRAGDAAVPGDHVELASFDDTRNSHSPAANQQRDCLAASFPILSRHWGADFEQAALAWLQRKHGLRVEVGRVILVEAGIGGAA